MTGSLSPTAGASPSDHFSVSSTSHVVLETLSDDIPSVPDWFAEVTVVLQVLQHRGVLQAISDQVRLPRGKAGTFTVLDYALILVAYALSGEPTLAAFYTRLTPFQDVFAALLNRKKGPHASSLSRFLADVTPACVARMRQVMEHDLFTAGLPGEAIGGLWDHQGTRHLIFDVDATRQVARQRSLTTDAAYPPPQRRKDQVCARGYRGHKRGETVRTRTTILQPFTQEWLGTIAAPGNGQYERELQHAIDVITRYLTTHHLTIAQGVLRLDGLDGTAATLTHVQTAGLGFVGRWKDYRLLSHAQVQQVVRHTAATPFRSPDSQTTSEVWDAGELTDWRSAKGGEAVRCRLIVLRRDAPSSPRKVKVGKLVPKEQKVYELFVTTLPATALSATEVVRLSHHRGSFEQVLADEDQEQTTDRWCSGHGPGQEFWQIVSQLVWNVRGQLGHQERGRAVRWTQWCDGSVDAQDVQENGGALPESPVTGEPSPPHEEQEHAGTTGETDLPHGPAESGKPTETVVDPEAESPDSCPRDRRAIPPSERAPSTDDQPATPENCAGTTSAQTPQMPQDGQETGGEHHPQHAEGPPPTEGSQPMEDTTGKMALQEREPQRGVPMAAWCLLLSSVVWLVLGVKPRSSRTCDGNGTSPPNNGVGAATKETQAPAPPPMVDDTVAPIAPPPGTKLVLSHARCHDRYTGNAFVVEADGTVRCPAGNTLTAQRSQRRPNGTVEVRFAARIGDCRACSQRSQCVPPTTQSPRTITGTYQPGDPESLSLGRGSETIVWWCDSGGRIVRRAFRDHLRTQQVTITQERGEEPTISPKGERPQVMTRNQRAHRRLSWQERCQRNARPRSAPRYRIHIAGISPRLARTMGQELPGN